MNEPRTYRSDAGLAAELVPRLVRIGGVILLAALAALFAHVLISRTGLQSFALALGGLVGLALLAWVSFRNLTIVMLVWLVVLGGVRRLLMVHMPGLPDFSLDRLFLVWIILIFFLRLILERKKLEGPFLADLLIVAHTLYVLVQLNVMDSVHFHAWVISGLSPLFAYIYGKNIVKSETDLNYLLAFILIMTCYFYVQSIAQQHNWTILVWPKQTLDPNEGFWTPGRSRGPFFHAPLFGQVSSMFLMVYFFMITRARKFGWKVLLLISLGLSILGLFYTYTRGPWLATAVGLMVLGLLRPNYRRILLAMAVVGMIGGILGVSRLANQQFLQERVENTNTVENRMAFLATATRMVRDHPVFGVGFFRYNDYRDHYNQTTYFPFYGMVRRQFGVGMPIHDIYLGRLAEEGAISIALMFGFYFVVFKAFVRQWRRNPVGPWFNRDTLAVFAAMMASYLVGGMVIDYRYFDMVNVIFFLLAGIIYGYRSQFYTAR